MSELPFLLKGCVVPGKQLGSKLGFPTANIAYDPLDRPWPKEGVYVGIAQVEGESCRYVAILNQGSHPTAPGGAPTVEAHLLGHPEKELYGRRLILEYRAYLRPEARFPSLDALREQLCIDQQNALIWARKCAPELILSTPPKGAANA